MSVEKFRPYSSGKTKHESKPYSLILNKPAQECSNLEAIGLWAHFQTLPEDWIISPQYIQNKFNIGKDKVYKLLNYLISVKLLDRKRIVDDAGRHEDTIYIIRNGEAYSPLPEISEAVENPLPDLPLPVFPLPVNQDTTNNRFITNEKEILQKKQKAFGKSFKNRKAVNQEKHSFAHSKDQMGKEKEHIQQHEEIKKIECTEMPAALKNLVKKMKDEKYEGNTCMA